MVCDLFNHIQHLYKMAQLSAFRGRFCAMIGAERLKYPRSRAVPPYRVISPKADGLQRQPFSTTRSAQAAPAFGYTPDDNAGQIPAICRRASDPV